MSGKIGAVIFDLDGALVDSEQVWDDMHEKLGVKMPPEEISAAVVRRMEERIWEASSRRRSLPRRSPAASPPRTTTSKRHGGCEWTQHTAQQLRTPAAASSPLTPPGCVLWPSPTVRSLPQKMPSRLQTLRYPLCKSCTKKS